MSWRGALCVLCLAALGMQAWPARAAGATAAAALRPQHDPRLRAVIEQAIHQARCFTDRYDSAVWFRLMDPRLRPFVPDARERTQILQTVYCEARRPGRTPLPPGLIMAMLDVESAFNRWAVSTAGAVGLMQVMPFWPVRLGMRRYQLVRVGPNVRMGCAILRFDLRLAHHSFRRALELYNGSSRPAYANRVIVRWTEYWNGADRLGLERTAVALKR